MLQITTTDYNSNNNKNNNNKKWSVKINICTKKYVNVYMHMMYFLIILNIHEFMTVEKQ